VNPSIVGGVLPEEPGEIYVNPFWSDAVRPLDVTTTVAGPTMCCGVVAVSVAASTSLTSDAAVPPIVTVAPVEKFAPAIVTTVPPKVEPLDGDTLVMRGSVDEGPVGDPPQANRGGTPKHTSTNASRR
jgi:hypothetical protein